MNKKKVVLILGLILALAACGKEPLDNEEIKVPEPPSTMATTTETTTTTTTTKATTRKTTKATTATTTTATTTAKAANTGAASPIGKWKISNDEDNEMAEYFADSADELSLSGFTFEFAENSYCTMEVESDVSSMMNLSDNGFNFYGITYEDIAYDGNTLTLNADGERIDFKRIGAPDINSKYGQYTCDMLADDEDDFGDEDFDKKNYIFDFRSSGKTYMIVSVAMKYTYDAEKKTMSFMGQDDIAVEFEGNKMIMKTKDDSRSVFERIN